MFVIFLCINIKKYKVTITFVLTNKVAKLVRWLHWHSINSLVSLVTKHPASDQSDEASFQNPQKCLPQSFLLFDVQFALR